MRTKKLLLTAALLAVGAAISMAQVYSVNVVGYVNVEVPQGFSMVANPLDGGDNDTIAELIPTAPVGATIYKFDGATFSSAVFDEFDEAWIPADMTLEPGTGVFIDSPETFTITFVGEVLQGELSNELPSGLSIVGSLVPMAGNANELELPAVPGMTVYKWTGAGYTSAVFDEFDEAYIPADLVIGVGEAFWVENPGAAIGWDRTFTVN